MSDTSGANLVGLYIISDVLSSSSTSVVRHAWRFRQLFEAALKERKTFERLGMMAHRHGWGRMRAEKWKRSVGLVLNLWEGWCVFPAGSQELFVRSFEQPPELRAAMKAEEVGEERRGRWKPVEGAGEAVRGDGGDKGRGTPDVKGEAMEEEDAVGEVLVEDVEGEPMSDEDVKGEPMDDDVEGEPMDDVEGEPMDDAEGEPMDEDEEGEPMEEDDPEGEPMEESDAEDGGGGGGGEAPVAEYPRATAPAPADEGEQAAGAEGGAPPPVAFSSVRKGPRSRMRAVDMFADSTDE